MRKKGEKQEKQRKPCIGFVIAKLAIFFPGTSLGARNVEN